MLGRIQSRGGNVDMNLFDYSESLYICDQVLFVSPERFLNEEFLLIFKDALPISLVAIDEAHCISEW